MDGAPPGDPTPPVSSTHPAAPDPIVTPGGCGCDAPGGRPAAGNAVSVVGVRLAGQIRVSQFNARGLDFEQGDRVAVEGERGMEIGEVAQPTTRALKMCSIGCMKSVLRLATDEDLRAHEERARQESEAGTFCRERIRERRLPMKLVRAEQTTDTRKLTFFFTADGRVDFRDLVKDLAGRFHSRIEMRQIGARDEARVRGGYGDCGKALCCSTFLKEFAPISIKMAKAQNLSLNPSKISGMCGRLKCCLRYEYVPQGGEAALPPEDEPLPPAPSEGPAATTPP